MITKIVVDFLETDINHSSFLITICCVDNPQNGFDVPRDILYSHLCAFLWLPQDNQSNMLEINGPNQIPGTNLPGCIYKNLIEVNYTNKIYVAWASDILQISSHEYEMPKKIYQLVDSHNKNSISPITARYEQNMTRSTMIRFL